MGKEIASALRPAIVMTLLFAALLGIAYPLAMLLVLSGCAELPARRAGRAAPSEESPTVVGPGGLLVEAQADRMLARIESRSAADDILHPALAG